MSIAQITLLLIPSAYLLGAIPFGLIVAKTKGIDPRTAGSGNTGATNVGRLLGGKYFAIVFTLDVLKGLIPTALAGWILHGNALSRTDYLLWLLVGFSAVLGHMFSIFLRFKGGKGVATGAGVALGVFPYFTVPALIAGAAFIVCFKITRIVSISSIIGAIVLPIAYVLIGLMRRWDIAGAQLPLLCFSIFLCALIVYRHRGNIARLRAGTENRFTRSTHK